jgi:non-ribosomal peptide synthetase component E (peptide arylation enzyme)
MTETQAGLYTRPGDSIETVAGSAGRPSPGTEVRVVGPDDAVLAAGDEGELHVRGPLLFPGYFNHPQANRDAFTTDGWFRTGDLAVIGAGGNVAITGRCKDVINRGGIKYNPRDIEDLLAAHPRIDMAAIVPVPDPVLGERACCCITVAGDPAPTLEAICAYLDENGVAKVGWPERLEVFDAMPLTATRKIIKGKLIQRL